MKIGYICSQFQDNQIMSRVLKGLIVDFGRRRMLKQEVLVDFAHLSERLRLHHVNLHTQSLRRLWSYLQAAEKPKRKTLDRLALFAGFQTWNDLRIALRGDADAQLNYEDDPKSHD